MHPIVTSYRALSKVARPSSSIPVPRFLSQPAQELRPTRASPTPLRPSFHRQHPKWSTPLSAQNATTSTPSQTPRTSAQTTPHVDHRMRFLLTYHDLERALERRGLKSVRSVLAAVAVILAGVGLMWPRIKRWGAVETAEVAAASLETSQLQESATAMVKDVLSDPGTEKQVEQVLKKAVGSLFKDEEFLEWSVEWCARILGDALQKGGLKEEGVKYVKEVLMDEESLQVGEEYLREALSGVVADKDVQDSVARGIWQGVRASLVGRRRVSVREEGVVKAKQGKDNVVEEEAVEAAS